MHTMYILRLYSSYFLKTICEKKYEITARMVNVVGYTEILPKYLVSK